MDTAMMAMATNTQTQHYQIFTFAVEDMLFGLDVSHVLMLDQNIDKIQSLPTQQHGFCGVVKFQGLVVPVLDFAVAIGKISELNSKTGLAEQLHQVEQQLLRSFHNLQQCILNDDKTAMLAMLQPNWRDLSSGNATFNSLITQLETPYKLWRQASENIERQLQNNASEQAHMQLEQVREQLKQMMALLQQLHDHLNTGIRPVLLFITRDGKTPSYAMVVTEIRDVVDYTQLQDIHNHDDPVAVISSLKHTFKGLFTDAHSQCYYLNTDAFLQHFSNLDSATASFIDNE